jgi:hypothetical protein
MDPAAVGAMAAVLGSFVGGTATFATAWITQRTHSRGEIVSTEIRQREALYAEFIAECSKLLIDSHMHTLQGLETMLSAYALVNRIRLRASKSVLAEAENLMRLITEQYFSANLSLEEIRELALSRSADPLKAFGEACRAELKSVRTAV